LPNASLGIRMFRTVAIVILVQTSIGAAYFAKKASDDLSKKKNMEAYLYCIKQNGGTEQTCRELAYGEKSNNR